MALNDWLSTSDGQEFIDKGRIDMSKDELDMSKDELVLPPLKSDLIKTFGATEVFRLTNCRIGSQSILALARYRFNDKSTIDLIQYGHHNKDLQGKWGVVTSVYMIQMMDFLEWSQKEKTNNRTTIEDNQ